MPIGPTRWRPAPIGQMRLGDAFRIRGEPC
jgi:hypothetical protein